MNGLPVSRSWLGLISHVSRLGPRRQRGGARFAPRPFQNLEQSDRRASFDGDPRQETWRRWQRISFRLAWRLQCRRRNLQTPRTQQARLPASPPLSDRFAGGVWDEWWSPPPMFHG